MRARGPIQGDRRGPDLGCRAQNGACYTVLRTPEIYIVLPLLTPIPLKEKRALPQSPPGCRSAPSAGPRPPWKLGPPPAPVPWAARPRPRHWLPARPQLPGTVPSITPPPRPRPARACSPAAPRRLPAPPWAPQVQRALPCLATTRPPLGPQWESAVGPHTACRPVLKFYLGDTSPEEPGHFPSAPRRPSTPSSRLHPGSCPASTLHGTWELCFSF